MSLLLKVEHDVVDDDDDDDELGGLNVRCCRKSQVR